MKKTNLTKPPGQRKQKAGLHPTAKANDNSGIEKLLKLISETKMPVTLFAQMLGRQKFFDETSEVEAVIELADQITTLAQSHVEQIGKIAADIAMTAEKFSSPAGKGEKVTAAWSQLQESCDVALARLAREATMWIRFRTAKTTNADLLLEAASCIHNPGHLTNVIDRYVELNPEETTDPQGLSSFYADYVWQLVYHLTGLCDRCPESIRGTARTYPCWPTLQFRHKAGNTDFGRLANQIGLGEAAVIDATEVARYHWRTPLNRYVLFTLWRVDGVLAELKHCPDEPIAEVFAYRLKKELHCEPMQVEELPLYELARTLKPLTKSTAKTWSDKIISPLVFALEKNFSDVPELREVIRHANYDTRACHEAVLKTAIKRSLQSMAPP